MTAVSRSLDDLDRLAFRLQRTVRTQYPQLQTQGFTLIDLEARLLPFREARREMADGGADAFERAILRLIAGERGYITSDPELRDASLQALSGPSPSLSLVRAWATSSIQLASPAAAVGGESVLSSGESRSVTVGAPDRALGVAGSTKKDTKGCGCRYCGNRLPEGRRLTFCPHCGTDLTKRQCPACSTELEVHWRFCVTCGRSADLPEHSEPVRRAS